MATQSQIEANRRNALHSTGPRTPEGKARSSANATTHGLTGRFRVLDTETQEDFDQLLEIHLDELHPATAYEQFLVEQIVRSQWLVARAQRLEADLIDDLTAARKASDNEEMLRNAARYDSARALTNLQRQAAAHQRAAFRAMDQLRAIRRDAAKAAQQNEPNSRRTPLSPADKTNPIPLLPQLPSVPQPPPPSSAFS